MWWQLLISLDELYYRLYYLAQSSAGMGSVLPDPSAYFNGWAWAPKHGTVAAYSEAHLPGQESSAIMQEVTTTPHHHTQSAHSASRFVRCRHLTCICSGVVLCCTAGFIIVPCDALL